MDLTQYQFDSISEELRGLVLEIPLKWGHVQNKEYDDKLKKVCNIFDEYSLADFKKRISVFDPEQIQYYLRRWFILRCAECDEYLFYLNHGVSHNQNRYDKKWDIKIDDVVQFDVKSTVIPRCFRYYYESVLVNPQGMVEFYYDYQSKSERYHWQNRLFIVHHSLVNEDRETKLRCKWGSKRYVFSRFVKEVRNIQFMTYKGFTAGVIFLVETEPGVLKHIISGLDNELLSIPQ